MMIKPFYKNEHNAKIVEVDGYGEINLEELPVRVDIGEPGLYEIEWANGPEGETLYHAGGSNGINYGGAPIGVIRIIEYEKNKKTELIEGQIYLCSDGNIRRLDKIEPDFLHYSMVIDIKGDTYTFMKLSKTHRASCEALFTEARASQMKGLLE